MTGILACQSANVYALS